MIAPLKYILFVLGLFASFIAIWNNHFPAAIVSTGALISYAIIEIQDVKINNRKDDIE